MKTSGNALFKERLRTVGELRKFGFRERGSEERKRSNRKYVD